MNHSLMKVLMWVFVLAALALPLRGQSRLDSDSEVVILKNHFEKPFVVDVVKDAPLFSNRKGGLRLGGVSSGMRVEILEVSENVFRVRGVGRDKDRSGWLGSWAVSAEDPGAMGRLKELYDREVQVRAFIAAGELAVGMTLEEVSQVRGKPTKTSVRKTGKGQAGRWEWVDYDEEKHYITRVDPVSGATYRQFSHVTQIEKNKTVVEFEDGVVTAIEESENRGAGGVRIVVPPVVLGW